MNYLLGSRKEKDDKCPSRLLCTYCQQVFKDPCALGVHVRVVHADEIKLENSRRALSLSGHYYDSYSAVRPLLAMPIGRPARARISGKTFFVKGSSTSDLSQPPTSVGSGSGDPSSLPEGHQEPAQMMPSFAASPYRLGPGGSRFYGGGGSSSSLQPPDVTEHRPGNCSDSIRGMPSFRSVDFPNPHAFNLDHPARLAPAVTGVCHGCGLDRGDMINEHIPMTSPPLGLGPDKYEAEMPLMRRPIEENEYEWKNSSKTSTLKTPSRIPSEDSLPTSPPSPPPPSPGCSNPTADSASDVVKPGDPPASVKEEDREDLDLTLHL